MANARVYSNPEEAIRSIGAGIRLSRTHRHQQILKQGPSRRLKIKRKPFSNARRSVVSAVHSGSPPLPPDLPPSGTDFQDDGERGRHHSWRVVLLGGMGLAGVWLLLQQRGDDACWHEDTATADVTAIIPVLNEETGIADCLQYLKSLDVRPSQILVVDGGSTDRTVELAKQHGAEVLQSAKGRATQMNAGARAASGTLLCFIHADSRPPRAFVTNIREGLSHGKVVMGGFRVIIEYQGRVLRWMTLHQLIKTYYAPLLFRPLSYARGLRALFGDQNLFCRKSDFLKVGGFDESLPIMEDLDLVMRLHQAGPSLGPERQSKGNELELYSRKVYQFPHSELDAPRICLSAEERGKLRKDMMQQSAKSGVGMAHSLPPSTLELQELMASASADQGHENSRPRARWARGHDGSSTQQPHKALPEQANRDARTWSSDATVVPEDAQLSDSSGHSPAGSAQQHRKQCRGRIKMIISPPSHSSGRRLAAMGNLWGTWVHFRIATHWYFRGSKKGLKELYDKLYTDRYR